MKCPCCGQTIDDLPIEGLKHWKLRPSERNIVNALVEAYPKRISLDVLIQAAYGSRFDGGPDDSAGTVRVHLTNIRKALAGSGWRLPLATADKGHQYRLERE